MADLMSGNSSYKILSNKYANFIIPTVKIKVNGTDVVKTMNLTIFELKATLSLYAASSVVIKIADLYDEKSHSFQSKVKSMFQLGTTVEVELGYLSSTEKIFKGYVAMLGVEVEEYALLVVTLMDARRLMMTSGKKQLLHDVKNYSDAFKTVMNEYASLCSATVDATNDKLEKPLSQVTNDYDFVTKELLQKGKANREFFIFAEKAYFREPCKITGSMLTVKYGRELLSLRVSEGYLDLKIEILGYHSLEQEAVIGKASAKGSLSQKKILATTPTLTVADPSADSQEKANIKAEALAKKLKDQECVGSGSTIGLPELVPGRYLEIESLDAMVNKKYYITEVTHIFDIEGYITQFEIGGCS